MNSIPAGIETSLVGAGFSPTEVLVLQRLLEYDALTLRELAGVTGKSTGVLDQATKKLLRKNIIRRDFINSTAKFTITSMDLMLEWMEQDLKHKREVLSRQHQSFEQFIHNLQHEKKRAEIIYFDGLDGLGRAYRALLNSGKEMIGYVPVFCQIEDHPLKDFMVEWFRQRRKRGIFSRIISHDNALGRRYQSRDPFEYRQTVLIDEKTFPFTYEKIIIGDTVACINYAEKRACLLRYPELAAMERSLFEGIWRQETKKKVTPVSALGELTGSDTLIPATSVPLRVRTLSGLRGFFLSPISIAIFCGIAVLSAALTFYLYGYTKQMQFRQMQETVKSIAATGAFQFDAKDLEALQVEKDWKKPQWGKVVKQLERIEKNNDDLVFVYIFRKTKNDPSKIEFVSDSHSLNPYANIDADSANDVDADSNGKIETEGGDKLQWPGQTYPGPVPELFLAYEKPTASVEMYEDSFGKVVSGFAPIKDANDKTIAVLGVDMKAKILDDRVAAVFTPTAYFVAIFLFFVLVRLVAFNRALFVGLWEALNMRKVLTAALLCAEVAFFVTFAMYHYMLRLTIDEIGSRTMAIVATAASQFDPKDLDQLHWARDMKKDAYQRVFNSLNAIRDKNPTPPIKYVYIYRHENVDDPRMLEFIADADSNYTLPSIGPDSNGNGVLDAADENVAPGQSYYAQNNSHMLVAFNTPSYEKEFYIDKWGTLLSAYVPIKDGDKSIAILGADIDASVVLDTLHKRFDIWMWFSAVLSIGLFLVWVRRFL